MTRIINLPHSKITKDGKIAQNVKRLSVSKQIAQRNSKKIRVVAKVQKP